MEEIIKNITEHLMRHDDHEGHANHTDQDDHGDTNSWDLNIAKMTAMICLFISSLFFGFLPMKLRRWLQVAPQKKSNKNLKPCSTSNHEDSANNHERTEEHAEETASQPRKKSRTVQMMLNFGGGVLIATTFLHLLPEINENIEALQAEGSIKEYPFHLAEFLMCCGFFLMFFIEELVHVYIHKKENQQMLTKKKESEKIEQIFQRNMSFRKKSFCTLDSKRFVSAKVCSVSQTNLISRSDENLNDKNCQDIPVISTQLECAKSPTNNLNNMENGDHKEIACFEEEENNLIKNLRGLLIVLALSVHELFEGLAVGLESEPANVYVMFGAVSAHKLVIAFCIGIELVTSSLKTYLIVIYIATFAVVSPLGIGIGLLVSNNGVVGISSVLLQGIACGTLMYVVFFEILLPSVQDKADHSHVVISNPKSHDHKIHQTPVDKSKKSAFLDPHLLEFDSSRRGTKTSLLSHATVEEPAAQGTTDSYRKLENVDSRRGTEESLNFDHRQHSGENEIKSDRVNGAKSTSNDRNEHSNAVGAHSHMHEGGLADLQGLFQCFAVLVGFLIMFGLQLLTGHQHNHSHEEEHMHDEHHHHH